VLHEFGNLLKTKNSGSALIICISAYIKMHINSPTAIPNDHKNGKNIPLEEEEGENLTCAIEK
jgi:hypothetical protein